VRFRSLGRDGLIEVTRQQQFRIDTSAPASTATSTPAGAGVTLAYEVTDPVPGSGAAGIHLVYRGVDGDKAQPYSTFEPGAQGVVTLPTRCSDIEFWAEDQAGNDEVTHQHLADAAPPDLIESPAAICLWPPNHGRFRFELGKDILAQDECDPSPQVRIVAVTSNAPDTLREAARPPAMRRSALVPCACGPSAPVQAPDACTP